MLPVNMTVSSLMSFIQEDTEESEKFIPNCVKRKRYKKGVQYDCPVLNAINDPSDNPAFQNLVSKLMNNCDAITLKLEVLDKSQRCSPEQVIKQYPIKGTTFKLEEKEISKGERGQGSSSPQEVKVVSLFETSEIRSITFRYHIHQEWEKSPNIYSISLECDHWMTAVKINLLMCNIFKLSSDDNSHSTENLTLKPEDEEHFIDMTDFITQPHVFEDPVTKEVESMLKRVLLSSKEKRLHDKGKVLLAKRMV